MGDKELWDMFHSLKHTTLNCVYSNTSKSETLIHSFPANIAISKVIYGSITCDCVHIVVIPSTLSLGPRPSLLRV